jgi:anti-sigma B factor antagonist
LATSDRAQPAEVQNSVNPGELAVAVVSAEGHHEVRLWGELDMSTAPQLREELQRLAVGEAPKVTVDLSGLAFVDSTGLSVLITGLKRFRQQGGDMVLRSPTPSTLRVLEITGLTEVFAIG